MDKKVPGSVNNSRALLVVGVSSLTFAGILNAQGDKSGSDKMALVERGEYLVALGGCNDCHTPWIMTPTGPRPDSNRFLSGHPADMKVTPPKLDMPWMAAASVSMTAWAGPWGISYASNLTPDTIQPIHNLVRDYEPPAEMPSGQH